MPDRLWIKDPLAIAASGAERGLVIEGHRIVELVAAGADPCEPVTRTFEAGRHVVLPGLVNAHHHIFQSLTRAHPQAANKGLTPWLEALYPLWARLTPETFRAAVRLSLVELLLSGCTTTADHHYVFPAGLKDAVDIEVAVARELGIRITATRGSIDLSQKDGGLAPDALAEDRETIVRDCERVLGLFHDRSHGAMAQIGLAPSSVLAASPGLMRDMAALACRFDCPLHIHLAETGAERDQVAATRQCRPVDVLEAAGWLDRRLWVAHGIHLDAEDAARLGRHGVGLCHCAASNMVLGSGLCPTLDLQRAGVTVGIGIDGPASNGGANMIESLRHALMLGRLRYGAAALSPQDVIGWGTEGSARCLGRDDIGVIAPGFCADLALFTLDEPRFAGAHDPLAALLLCGAHRADRVMVHGRWRVTDGLPVGLDLGRVMHDHREAARAFL